MNDFDPGPGWREIQDPYDVQGKNHLRLYDAYNDSSTYWVPEAPVLSLPTEPYTIIRVTSTSGMESILIRNELGWYEIDDMSAPVEQPLTGWSFEVLSEPRAVTAKAVLDRVQLDGHDHRPILNQIAQEFGVEP